MSRSSRSVWENCRAYQKSADAVSDEVAKYAQRSSFGTKDTLISRLKKLSPNHPWFRPKLSKSMARSKSLQEIKNLCQELKIANWETLKGRHTLLDALFEAHPYHSIFDSDPSLLDNMETIEEKIEKLIDHLQGVEHRMKYDRFKRVNPTNARWFKANMFIPFPLSLIGPTLDIQWTNLDVVDSLFKTLRAEREIYSEAASTIIQERVLKEASQAWEEDQMALQ